MKTFTLQLPIEPAREYPIYIGQNLLEHAELFASYIQNRPVCVVSNVTVAPRYLCILKTALSSAQNVFEILLPDGEIYKSQQSLNTLYQMLLEHHFERRGVLIALGGGVVGDITGFAAATYQRGVDFIQVPTTLLAMVDSSVGGKTAINHPLGKNMIGAFYQPKMVLIDTQTLKSLPKREFAAGMAEVVKYGAIGDAAFFHALTEQTWPFSDDFLKQIIFHSVTMKAKIVAEDEREAGIRAWLNFGHTFGHAIEVLLGLGQFLHGEAVSVGMLMAAEFSKNRGLLTEKDVQQFENLLLRMNLPVRIPFIDLSAFIVQMRQDKKVENERIRLIILEKIGQATLINDATEEELKRAILPFMH